MRNSWLWTPDVLKWWYSPIYWICGNTFFKSFQFETISLFSVRGYFLRSSERTVLLKDMLDGVQLLLHRKIIKIPKYNLYWIFEKVFNKKGWKDISYVFQNGILMKLQGNLILSNLLWRNTHCSEVIFIKFWISYCASLAKLLGSFI